MSASDVTAAVTLLRTKKAAITAAQAALDAAKADAIATFQSKLGVSAPAAQQLVGNPMVSDADFASIVSAISALAIK